MEPVSGVVLRVTERRTERSAPAGGEPVTLLDVTLTSDSESTRRLARLAGQRRDRLTALRTTVPLGCLLAALLLLIARTGYDAITAGLRRGLDVSRSSNTRW